MEEYWRWFMYQTKILPEQRVKCLEYFETPEVVYSAGGKSGKSGVFK